MVIKLLTHLLRLNNRNEYISFYSLCLEIFAILLSLFIYHFTSLAFSSSVVSSLQEYKVNYFEFIVIGEIILALPLFLLEGTYRKVKHALMDGVWDTLSYLKINRFKAVLFLVLSAFPRELVRIFLTLGLSYLFFDFHLNLFSILIIFGLVISVLPIFFSLGLVFSSILLKTGRGQAVIGYFLTIMSIGAGSFFPLSVLPEKFVSILYYFPYTYLLESSRLYLANENTKESFYLLPLYVWYLALPLCIYIFMKVTKNQTSDSIILK